MTTNSIRLAIVPGALVAALMLLNPPGAVAQSTSNRGAAVLIFPKVVTSAGRDTVIQLANTTNTGTSVLCHYVNGAPTNPLLPPGPLNPPLCTVQDFAFDLTPQQPTLWVVSQGRLSDAGDGFPGIDPVVPPQPSDFEGELQCIVIDGSGAPFGSNALIGTATIQDLASGDVARYNAVGLRALAADGDSTLQLDGAEYEACPLAWRFSHVADGGTDIAVGAGSSVEVDYTLVPCSRDLATFTPPTATVLFSATNEMEVTFSASTTVDCWRTSALSAISPSFAAGAIGDLDIQVDVRASGASPSGILAVAGAVHDSGGLTPVQGTSAFNGSASGVRATADTIVLP